MMSERARLTGFLLLLGCGWGLTTPLIKITVTAGYQPFGIIFWQMLIGAVLLGVLRWRQMGHMPVTAKTLAVWLMIATIGTLIPGTAGLDPFQALFGASAIGTVIALPIALGSGQFFVPAAPFILADFTLLVGSIVHVLVYAGYVWLIARARSVFAGQVSYVVTGSFVFWAMLLLGETYSIWVWLALLCMGIGLSLVQPRLAEPTPLGETKVHG